MRFDVEAGGQTRTVELRRGADGAFDAAIDGRRLTADAAKTGNTWSLLLGTRSYELVVVEQRAGELIVSVDGRQVPVSMAAARLAARLRGRTGAAEGKHGPQPIVAPMSGRIVKVLVKPGDLVAARQGLIVVEAMKMENELRSPKAGTVTEVRVAEGASVDASAVLIVVE